MDKCNLLIYYVTIFEEIPSSKDYNIFLVYNSKDINNFIKKKISDLIKKTYQEYLSRSPTEQEFKNFLYLFENSKINKKRFIEHVTQSDEFINLQLINNCINNMNNNNKIKIKCLNDFVDKIYLINLERRTDKFEKISNKLNELKINFKKINAIDGSNIQIRDEWIQYLEKGSKISSPGAYGCLLSHLQIFKDAKQNNYKNILILEDDIIFHKNFNNELCKLNDIPEDYSIIYLGATQFRHVKNDFKNYYQANESYGTFAYIIKYTIFDTLIDILEQRQLDIDVSLLAIQKLYKCYVLWENIIIADLSKSDIRTEQYTYEMFKWDVNKYDFNNLKSKNQSNKNLVEEKTSYIGYKMVNNIDDVIIDIENSKDIELNPGYSFLIRAKNEELLVEMCLESIVDIADEIIFVDNNSNDSTLEKAQKLANKYNNIFIYRYNIDVPRAGIMHEKAVASGSLNTLATYYNWCLSKVTRYNVIKWDCDFISIKENLVKMINRYDLKTRDDKFGIWFTGKTLFFGKYIREYDYYDEFRVFSKKHNFKWENYKGCETAAYYVWSLDKAYINGFNDTFSDIRLKDLNEYKKQSPPLFYEIKTKNDIKSPTDILDSRDENDNKILKLNIDDSIVLNSLKLINQKNYKILITIPSLTIGGGNLWTINIYKTLIEIGFDVKIYCNYISKNISDNVYIDCFDKKDILFNLPVEKIYNYIVENQISYIIQTTPLFANEYLQKLKNKVFIAVLTHSDVSYINDYIYKNISYIDKVITVNHKTIKKFSQFGIKNTHFLPNFITNIEYKKDKDITKKIGIISRLSTDKNIIMTLFAFRKFLDLSNAFKNYELNIVGDENVNIMNEIKFYINKLNLSDNVILHGYKKNVIDYYNMFDFIILPSVSEGCPYNLLEAALTGTPIICSNVGGNKEIVGNHSVLIELEDVESFSNNIIYINSYDDHLEYIGYKIVNKQDNILVPKELQKFTIIPPTDCINDNNNEKLLNLIKKWNTNVTNITNAFIEMINNYDYYKNEREKLYIDIRNRFSSKKVFVNHLVELLGLNFQMM